MHGCSIVKTNYCGTSVDVWLYNRNKVFGWKLNFSGKTWTKCSDTVTVLSRTLTGLRGNYVLIDGGTN